MFDLGAATGVLTVLVEGVRDDQLGAPTPCAESTVGDLLDHVDGLSVAFTAAATKTPLPDGNAAPSADASRLGEDWRIRIGERLAALAGAWRNPDSWVGMTKAGGLDLPAEVAGVVALDEIIIHGWDIAVASSQTFSCEPQLVLAAYQFVQPIAEGSPQGTPGLFGPTVSVPESAPLLDRLLGLTGRDPNWRAESRHN